MARFAFWCLFGALIVAMLVVMLFPNWNIEHPADPSLTVRDERHVLWRQPAHSHLDILNLWTEEFALAFVLGGVVCLCCSKGPTIKPNISIRKPKRLTPTHD